MAKIFIFYTIELNLFLIFHKQSYTILKISLIGNLNYERKIFFCNFISDYAAYFSPIKDYKFIRHLLSNYLKIK